MQVGRYCSIAKDVRYFGANHLIDNITTSAVFYNRELSHLDVNDVEPYTIVAGNQAKVIRRRFTDEQIQKIVDTKWWNYTPQELMKYYPDMADISVFCSKITGEN